MDTLWRDFRYGLRGLRNQPAFALLAILTLAVGIGANTAMFSVVYGVLVNPYPYAKPGEIWAPLVESFDKTQRNGSHTVAEFLELQKISAFADVMCTTGDDVLVTGSGRDPENLNVVRLSGNALQFLGVPTVVGRAFGPGDIRADGTTEPVCVISYKLWQRLFSGRDDAIGQTIDLNHQPHVVLGVMPPRFGWYGNDSLWLPLPTTTQNLQRGVRAIMRLAPGVSKENAEQQLHAAHQRFAEATPKRYPTGGFTTNLQNYLDVTVASGSMRSSLHALFYGVGFILLIACANVANLQLARATSRTREIAVRLALGASRGGIVRQLLSESVVLALLGGALGVALAFALTKVITVLMPENYKPNESRIVVDAAALWFSLGVSVLTGVLFGLFPSLQCSRPDLCEALKDGTRGSGQSVRGSRTRDALVVAEVALSVILLVGASLTIRGFVKLQQTDLGFHPERVLMVDVPLPAQRYATRELRNAFARDALDRVRRLPGVEDAAIGNFSTQRSTYVIPGQPVDEHQYVAGTLVSERFASVIGIPLRAGRDIAESDVMNGDHVVLINESAAKLWPTGQDPIGQTIQIDRFKQSGGAAPGSGAPNPASDPGMFTVIGIVGDTKNAGLENDTQPGIYAPYTVINFLRRTLVVRTRGEPMALLNSVRAEIRAIDPEQPIARALTLEDVVGFETVQPRFNMAVFGGLGAIGLILSAAGIFSVLSYHVTQRTHEIGVRMALGASRGDVLGLMIGRGGRLVAIGLVLGLAGSLALGKFLQSAVFLMPPTDPLSITAAAAVLSVVALFACYLPARRATRVDPMVALRAE